jgi:uncharacterized Fe-S center protein
MVKPILIVIKRITETIKVALQFFWNKDNIVYFSIITNQGQDCFCEHLTPCPLSTVERGRSD